MDHGVVHSGLIGTTCYRVILVDDRLDTGGTLISACEKLVSTGVDKIYIFVTHGLFTGEGRRQLWSLDVKHICCTNTIPPSTATLADNNISVLSIAPLFREALSGFSTELLPSLAEESMKLQKQMEAGLSRFHWNHLPEWR